MKYAIGVDIGGSHITAALVDQNGHIKARKKISFSKAPACADASASVGRPNGKQGLRLIKQSVSHLSSSISHLSLSGLGLACPGGVDSERGVVLADSPNLIGWKGTKVKQELEKALKIPVFIDNDANLAAWGEKCWGAGKKASRPSGRASPSAGNLVCLTLGTGVGGGIIIDNRIYRGSHFYAAEIGHMMVDPGGTICSCGKAGHLEALVSGPAIVERYASRSKFTLSPSPVILNAVKNLRINSANVLTAKTIFDKAKKGDELAREVVQNTAHYLGIACASLINIFDPEMVVIGGGVANAGEILFKPLRQMVKASIMPHPYRKPQIVPAKLGEDAGLLGAAALALQK